MLEFLSLELLAVATSVLGVAGVVGAAWFYERSQNAREQAFEEFLDAADAGDPLEFEPPDVSVSPLGVLAEWRHTSRAKRMAKKGYVKWYRLDSTLSRPTWVKPRLEGAGVPKVTVDGQPYYFPKDAMVADSSTGAWVALHREGAGDPINLRDPAYPGMEVDLVERTINLEAEDKPPGFLDDLLGMDQTTLMYLGIGALFLVYAVYRYMNGGL